MKKTRRNLLVVVIMVFALAFTLITPSTVQAAKAKNLKIKSAPKKIEVGKKAKIKTNVPAYFRSSRPAIASVNKKGVVSANAKGTVTITVINKKRIAQMIEITIKITPSKTKPDPDLDTQPSNSNITVEYKGKIPLGTEYNITRYGTIAKVKNADGTEQILNPKDYTFSCYKMVEKDGKQFAECIFKYGEIQKTYYVEVVDAKDAVPTYLSATYPDTKILKKGEQPNVTDLDAYLLYPDGRKEPVDFSTMKLQRSPGDVDQTDNGYIYHTYDVLYENTYEYNGEKLYHCCFFPVYVYYEK